MRPICNFVLCLIVVLIANTGFGQQTKETGTQEPAASEFTVLFDGTSMDNFRGYHQEAIGKGWKIDDGTLMYDGTGGGDIITKASYDNFELQFDWKVTEGANSGVMYRVTLGDNAPYFSGPEYQILDDAKHPDGKNELTSAGSLYAMYKPTDKKLNPVGSWNTAKIVVVGNRIEHWLNGHMVVTTDVGSPDWNKMKDASKFKTWEKFGTAPNGHICFQDHGNKVWFRNIKIKSLN